MRHFILSGLLALSSAALFACSGDKSSDHTARVAPMPPPAEPMAAAGVARASGEMPTEAAGETNTSAGGSLDVDESVRVPCNLPNERDEAPRFDFDEAELHPRGERILAKVAACLHDGALADDSVVIVGHADPRGTEEYNQDLGMRRAETARDYLISQGVPADRLRLETRGEAAALGIDESGWRLDRRVEIRRSEP